MSPAPSTSTRCLASSFIGSSKKTASLAGLERGTLRARMHLFMHKGHRNLDNDVASKNAFFGTENEGLFVFFLKSFVED